MVNEITMKRLKRNFDEVVRKQEEEGNTYGIEQIIDHFNDILENIQEEHPESKISEFEKVEATGHLSGGHPNNLEEIRLKILDIVEFLELDREDFQQVTGDNFPFIHIEQNQSQSQYTNLKLTFKDVENSAKREASTEEEKEQLEALIEDFRQEIKDQNPDKPRLGSLYKKALSMSGNIASQLIIMGIKHGIDLTSLL